MEKQLSMEFLKNLFNDRQLSYDELLKAVEAHNKADKDNQIKIANLAGGEYISKEKYDAKEKELTKANDQITHKIFISHFTWILWRGSSAIRISWWCTP